jgi:hypothetical protein
VSDSSPGPGWWRAPDGKWYAPELLPTPTSSRRFGRWRWDGREWQPAASQVEQSAFVGAAVLGVLGALGGLVQGMRVDPSTAWFAVFELGIPALVFGAFVGAFFGWVTRSKY